MMKARCSSKSLLSHYHVSCCGTEGHKKRTVVLWGALFERWEDQSLCTMSVCDEIWDVQKGLLLESYFSTRYFCRLKIAWSQEHMKQKILVYSWEKIGYTYIYMYLLQGLKKSHPRNNGLLGLFGIAWGRTCLYCPLLLPDLLKGAGCKTIAVHLTLPPPESSSPNVKDTLG